MAKESKLSIGATVTGDGETCTYVPRGSPMTNATAPTGGTVDLVLAAGNNVVTLPVGAIGVVIDPPVASTNAKDIKGVAGDTGVPMRPGSPMVLNFAAGTVNFSIQSAGIETIALHWL